MARRRNFWTRRRPGRRGVSRVCEAGQRRAESDEFVGTAVTPRWEHQLCDAGARRLGRRAASLPAVPEAVWRVSISLYRPLRDVDRFKVLIDSADHNLFFRHRSFLPDPTPKSFGLIKKTYTNYTSSPTGSRFRPWFRIWMTQRGILGREIAPHLSPAMKFFSPRESPRTFAG